MAMEGSERDELARKLDKDIDDFMDELVGDRKARGEPSDRKPFDYDEWVGEIEKHPAFMAKLGEDGVSEAVEALQAMKYDDDDTPEDRARQAKDDGNRCFKYKKYRNAADAYTEGIKTNCLDRELMGQLYANRAAAHVFLRNERSAAKDCLAALAFSPTHSKAALRGAQAFLNLREPERAQKIAAQIAPADMTQEQRTKLTEIQAQATRMVKEIARDDRKDALTKKKALLENLRLLSALKARKLNFTSEAAHIDFEHPERFEASQLEIRLPQLEDSPSVHFVVGGRGGGGGEGSGAGLEAAASGVAGAGDEYGTLGWPVLLLYPERGQSDFVRAFPEWNSFRDQMSEVLATPPEWDTEGHYSLKRIALYYDSSKDADTAVQIPLDVCLAQIMAREDFEMKEPLPTFTVLDTQSSFYQHYFSRVKQRKTFM